MKKTHILTRTVLIPALLSAMLFAEEVPQKIIDTGEKVSQELMKALSSKLQHEIKENGLIQAAAFCNINALTLTEEVNLHQVQGVSVKRISLKERNAANTPDADEKKVLESMQKMLEEKKLPAYLVEHTGKRYKYYKPLVIKKEACLKCHGDISKNPELSQFMKEHYPFDKAQGYKMGDLRGAMVVEITQ
jgi:uncharacterized protein DUF3365